MKCPRFVVFVCFGDEVYVEPGEQNEPSSKTEADLWAESRWTALGGRGRGGGAAWLRG